MSSPKPPRKDLLAELELNSLKINQTLAEVETGTAPAAGSGKQAVRAIKGQSRGAFSDLTQTPHFLPKWSSSPDSPSKHKLKHNKPKAKAKQGKPRKCRGKLRLTKREKYMEEAQAEALRMEREIRHKLMVEAKRLTQERKERRRQERLQARAWAKARQRRREVTQQRL